MNILFPFLGAIVTASLFAYFIFWKRTEDKTAPKPALITPKKPQYTVPAETFAPVDYGVKSEEGFTMGGPNFPSWNGPSIKMSTYIRDQANYHQYTNTNLYPSQDLLDTLNSLPIVDEVIPDFGSSLSNFDAEITHIPWDAENAQYLQSKVVWGHVSMDASKSIFTKMYIQKALSDPKNLSENANKDLLYHSLFLGESAYDPNTAQLLTLADTTLQTVGQVALVSVATEVYKACVNGPQNMLAAKINSVGVDKLTSKELKVFKYVSTQSRIAHELNSAREAKLLKGETLTAAEALEHELYSKRFAGFMERAGEMLGRPLALATNLIQSAAERVASVTSKIASTTGKPVQAVGRYLAKLGPVVKLMAGVQTAVMISKMIGNALIAQLAAKLETLLAKAAALTGVTVMLDTMAAVISTACASPALPIMLPLAIIVDTMATIWSVLDALCMAIFLALQVILPSLLTKAFENGGTCPAGSNTLASLIGDDALYFILTSFVPPIMVLDAFSEYICYKSDGSLVLKNPYAMQPYMADTSLSVSKHSYAKGTEPRGDYTTHKNTGDSLPPGWTLTAGIARGPCDPGTWTSSDVDLLCNISTYVPRTYVKYTHVPRTYAKYSHVPTTYAKKSHITTYTRNANIYPVDYKPCAEQWPGEGGNLNSNSAIGPTLDCYGDTQNTVYMSCGCRRWSC